MIPDPLAGRDQPGGPATRWRLPELGPRLMLLYRLGWAALFLAALVATGLTLARIQWDGPERLPLLRVGINYTRDATPYLLVYEVPGAEARRSGIRPGDHIVELADQRALDEALGTVVDARDGTAIALTVQHPDGSRRRAVLRASSGEVAAALHSVGLSESLMGGWSRMILGLGAAIALVASALLYRQRRNSVAALLAVAALVPVTMPTGLVGYQAALIAAAFGVALTNIAILAFPDGRFELRLSRMLALANLAWLGVFFLDPDLHAQGIYPAIALSELAVVARYRRSVRGIDRQQIRWAALGFAGAAIFSLAAAIVSALAYRFNGLLATIVNDMTTDALDLGNSLCLWGGLGIALLRFRLYDADVAITRSAVWVVAAPLLAILFGAVVEVAKVVLTPYFPSDGIALAIAGVLTASVIQPVGDRVRAVVERWSRANLIALAKELPQAVHDMEETADASRMMEHVCHAAAPAVRAERIALATCLDGEGGSWTIGAHQGISRQEVGEWLSGNEPPEALETAYDRTDPLLPLRVPLVARPDGEPRAIGWMLIGRRPDGSIPDSGAIAMLEEIARRSVTRFSPSPRASGEWRRSPDRSGRVAPHDIHAERRSYSVWTSLFRRLARPAGFEPAAPSLEGSCSIQLSYGRASASPSVVWLEAEPPGYGVDIASHSATSGAGWRRDLSAMPRPAIATTPPAMASGVHR